MFMREILFLVKNHIVNINNISNASPTKGSNGTPRKSTKSNRIEINKTDRYFVLLFVEFIVDNIPSST